METMDLYSEIGHVLSQAESIQVLTALRQDPLVWRSLQQPDFLSLVLDSIGSQVQCWNPGQLALINVVEIRPEALRAEPMVALGHTLQEKALRSYQSTQRSGSAPATLAEAGLLALALRERRRLTGTWTGLLQEILPRPAQAETGFLIWRTALACLYAMIPDPLDMLRALMPKVVSRIPLDWVVLSQLAQPFDEQDHIIAFIKVLKNLPVSLQLNTLRSLSLHGRERMAAQVAEQLLIGHPAFANMRMHQQGNNPDLAGLSNRALTLQQLGTYYHLAGDREQALSLYTAAETTLQEWLAGLNLQRINLRGGVNQDEAGVIMDCGQIANLASAAGWLKNELGVALVSHPYASSILDQLPGDQDSGFLAIRRAASLADTEPAIARDIARRAAQELVVDVAQMGIPFSGEYVYAWRPGETLQILLDLGLENEALSLAQAVLETRPVDLDLLNLTANILARVNNLEESLSVQRTVVALEPCNPAWRRMLAELWARRGDWRRSYSEWQMVLSLSAQPEMTDRLSCANSALQSGALAEAVAMSEAILNEDANNGAALGILGQALIGQGEAQAALNYLVRATLLSPETLAPWLALADIQRMLGEPQQALETLRAAVTALPEEYESHLAYGEACSQMGMLAEGLPHLRKAFLLSPESGKVVLLYAQALRCLGHTMDAKAVLERIRVQWPSQPELAYEYAQVMLDLDDPEAALPVLESALRNGLSILDGYLLYAKILLGEFRKSEEPWELSGAAGRMQQADNALRRILEIEPDNLEARFLRADILRAKGDLEEALAAYRLLAELPEADAPEFAWRVQWGMARAALCLNRIDIAVAAFKEAVAVKPDSLMLQRGLAEASLQASLPQQALEAANNALQIASDHVENLAWYADFAARMGENQRAVAALERAVQINPQRPDLLVSLAQWQMSAGDLEAARSTLEAVARMGNQHFANFQGIIRRAAQMYLRMQDMDSALACFDMALTADPNPEPDLLFEVAELNARLGNLETALELAQRSQENTPQNIPVFMLECDLLTQLARPQAALAVLEHALRIIHGSEGDIAQLPEEQRIQLGEIHERFTHLILQEGNIPAALYHAEKAFALQPKKAALAYRAAELAYSLLQNDRAARILAESLPEHGFLPQVYLEQGFDGLNLLCLHIEAALAGGREAAAQEWVEGGWSLAPHTPRLLAAEARLLARRGDLVEANKAYETVLQLLKKELSPDLQEQPLWLAEAALEANAWRDANPFYENYALRHPGEARGQLLFARVLVIAAEQQRLCETLRCINFAPGAQALSEACQRKFSEAIQAAARLANVSETARWQARGQAVFSPNPQTVRVLAQMPSDAEDVAALIGALRQINNRPAAMQVYRRYPHHGKVLLQLALCYLNEDSLEGLAIAEQAVQAMPNLALAHAALARLASGASALNRAIESYGKALEIWPSEPEWHDAAGDLFMQISKIQQAVWHRKQAVELVPNQPRYAAKLGQACLARGDNQSALEFLERSTVLDAQQPDVWLALASAYHMAGQLPQAMEAAKQAGMLNPSSAEGLLIAGETALAMNQIEQAHELAHNAVRREPENASALLFLCSVLKMEGKVEQALAAVEASSPALKQFYPVAFERAKLIHQVHGAQASLDLLEKLARDYPEESSLISFLAQTQAECGDVKAAERYAFKALRIDPNQPDLTLMLGRLQRKSGQLDQAIHLLGEVIRMSPNDLAAYHEMASVYQERREFIQALQVYRQAMRIAPSDYLAYYQSGLILRDSKDYSAAEAMLRKAAELAPENLSIRRQLVGVIALNLVHNKAEVSLS